MKINILVVLTKEIINKTTTSTQINITRNKEAYKILVK